MDRLLEAGALDVWYTPIFMKKNRPAVLISVLCRPMDEKALTRMLLQETTTLGVRSYTADRHILDRQFIRVETPYGPVTMKAALGCGFEKAAPEYEDVKGLALLRQVPFRAVYEAALQAYQALAKPEGPTYILNTED